MINALTHDISALYCYDRDISYLYNGILLIWGITGGCFASGVWIGDLPWYGTDVWKAE